MALRFLLTSFLLGSSLCGFSQIARDFLVGGSFDIVKTNNDSFASKAQIGMEGNYFITRQFTGSGGLEIWTGDEVSVVLGARWFPVEEAFVRMRGLIGENDLSIGGGWTRPVINEHWKFEAIGDFYFKGEFAIRVGLMYVIRMKE